MLQVKKALPANFASGTVGLAAGKKGILETFRQEVWYNKKKKEERICFADAAARSPLLLILKLCTTER